MLLADEKIPLNDDAPIKLMHWQNVLREVQPDENTKTLPIKAVQTTLTFETPFNKTPKIMEVEGQKVIVLKNAKLDSKKTMGFKEASLNALEMFSYQNDIYLLSKKAKDLEVQASSSKDKKQIRFLFYPKVFTWPHRLALKKTLSKLTLYKKMLTSKPKTP